MIPIVAAWPEKVQPSRLRGLEMADFRGEMPKVAGREQGRGTEQALKGVP
jgi:hypothetical protein